MAKKVTKRYHLPVLALFVLIAFIARAQTFGSPTIEFDEQFYLLVGDRILSGALPYVDIWDRKPIGLFLIFAAIRMLGGDAFMAYQIVATLVVGMTAVVVYLLAIKIGAPRYGGICAGVGYIFWLNLLQGEGGQASVFYNLPIAIAALLVAKLYISPDRQMHFAIIGSAAMLLIGLAIQIKYTAALEGIGFGLLLLLACYQRRIGIARIATLGLLWVAIALLPTLAAMVYYTRIGHFETFVFANFQSLALRGAPPTAAVLSDLVVGVAIVSLPFCFAFLGLKQRAISKPATHFIWLWLFTSIFAMMAIRTFSPHYFIPITIPIMVAASLALAKFRKLSVALLAIAAIAGQSLLAYYDWAKGGRDEAQAMVAAIGQVPNCLYVHNGFPSLYIMTGSCLPTRFVFPGLLNTQVEAGALGIDSRAEVIRILANKPDAIVTDLPVFSQANHLTQALVDAALARDYHLVLKLKTGTNRFRMVYRINFPKAAN